MILLWVPIAITVTIALFIGIAFWKREEVCPYCGMGDVDPDGYHNPKWHHDNQYGLGPYG